MVADFPVCGSHAPVRVTAIIANTCHNLSPVTPPMLM